MSTLEELAMEYRQEAAKLAMAIDRHSKAGDLPRAQESVQAGRDDQGVVRQGHEHRVRPQQVSKRHSGAAAAAPDLCPKGGARS